MFSSDLGIKVMLVLQDELDNVLLFLSSGGVCARLELFLPKVFERILWSSQMYLECVHVCFLPSFSSCFQLENWSF